ncbi:MAG: hypothetical protein FH751_15040 [Firmicutes bacterium]|nr:hypothetical protein [Bacillota bacterium]
MWGNQEDQKWLTKLIKRYISVNKKSENKEKSTIPDFSTVEGVKKILNNSGFKNMEVYKEENKVIYKDKNEWWQEMWSNAARNILEKIDSLGKNEIEEFKKEVFNELEKFRCEEGFCFRMPVIYALGTK